MIVYSDYNESLLQGTFSWKGLAGSICKCRLQYVLYVLPSRKLERYLEFS